MKFTESKLRRRQNTVVCKERIEPGIYYFSKILPNNESVDTGQ